MGNSATVKNALVKVGYDIRAIPGEASSFAVSQNGKIHLLSMQEAESLAGAHLPHPVNLADYTRPSGGIVPSYRFDTAEPQVEQATLL